MTNQQEKQSVEPKKESTVVDLADFKEETVVAEEPELFVDDETIKESGPKTEVKEVLDENNEMKYEEPENIESDSEIEDDPEILALKRQMDELKESKRLKAEEEKRRQLLEQQRLSQQNIQQTPQYVQQPEQIAFIDNFGMLKLMYEKLNNIEYRLAMLTGNVRQ